MPAAKIAEALRTSIAELGLDEQEEQGRLFATLRFVEQGLADDLQLLLGLVGLHEGYVRADLLELMAEKVDAGWTRQRIDRLMEALGVAGLVRAAGRGDHEMHPLLTSYLRSRGDPSEPCQRAFVDVIAQLAEALVPQELHKQRALFELFGGNFHFAWAIAGRLAMDEHVDAITQCLAKYAFNSRNFELASRLYTRLAARSAARGYSKGEGVAYHQLGMVAEEEQDFAAAQQWYLKSLAIKEKLGDPSGLAETWHELGVVAQVQGDLATARESYLKSLAFSERHDMKAYAAKTYHQLGLVAEERGDLARARDLYLKSLAIEEARGNLLGGASSYYQLGEIAKAQHDLAQAQKWHLKSLDIEEKLGNLQGASRSHHALGSIAVAAHDFATARERYLRALAIAEKQGDMHSAAINYNKLGVLAGIQGSFEEGGGWSVRSATAFLQTHDQESAAQAIQIFFACHQEASPADKQKLEAIWRDANLGPFLTEPSQ
jgi:tetratricopeptide (TPR) repeat protein